MNTAAAIAFITVMLTGLASLTGLVWRDRRRTQPATDDFYIEEFIGTTRFHGGDIYQQTVAALGDPKTIDTRLPCPPWPDAEARS